MKKTIFAALIALAAAAGHAATVPLGQWDGEWYHIDSASNDDSYITATTQNADGTQSVWLRTDYKKPRNVLGKLVSSVKTHSIMNCDSGLIRGTTEVQYDADGGVVRSFDNVVPWSEIVPGSVADRIHTVVCRKPAQPTQ